MRNTIKAEPILKTSKKDGMINSIKGSRLLKKKKKKKKKIYSSIKSTQYKM